MYATCVTIPHGTETATSVEALITETPEGLIAHVGGPVEEGWRIIDVWESEAHHQRFQREVLDPAILKVTGGAMGDPVDALTVTGQLERRGKALASV